MKAGIHLRWTAPLLLLLGANGAQLAAQQDVTTLWISDDVNTTIYHTTLSGTVISSFHSGSISELSLGIGPEVGTLWAAKEGSNQVVRFDKAGNTLASFPGTTYDAAAEAPEGVAVDFADGTLWIVDDVTDLVYHTQTDGTLISSFSTALYDAAATSPQGIAADPTDGTLWLVDNVSHRVYNVTKQGALVSSFPASAFGPVTLNLQGVSVDGADRSLWVTARNTHLIYHLTRTGTLLSTLDAALFGSHDPTGVAVEHAKQVTLLDMAKEITNGLSAGLVSPLAAKKLVMTLKQAQKQYDKGHMAAVASIMTGFEDQLANFVAAGQLDPELGRDLLVEAAYLVDDLSKL